MTAPSLPSQKNLNPKAPNILNSDHFSTDKNKCFCLQEVLCRSNAGPVVRSLRTPEAGAPKRFLVDETRP